MKFMLMMHAPTGTGDYQINSWSPDDFKAHIAFMMDLNKGLRDAGALIAAAEQWPASGIPSNPRGWLYHVALRRITDQLRSEMARRRREDAVASEIVAEWAFVPPPDVDVGVDGDDALVLLFMCCHPA